MSGAKASATAYATLPDALVQATAQNGVAQLPDSYEHYRTLVSAHLERLFAPLQGEVYSLCAYHLGWRDEDGERLAGSAGKMLRPVFCLTTGNGYGDPARAIGLGAAIELLHAFSLVHDDIEDGDRERRRKPTLWALYGIPLALNAGDCLFALAYRALHDAAEELSERTRGLSLRIFGDAVLHMIEGQHLDMTFESRLVVTTAQYTEMARYKTGALIGAALALGAAAGGAENDDVEHLQEAGVELGLAFQAVDDELAVWGDPELTGKAVGNDLARGKKALPVTLAMERGWDFSALNEPALREIREQFARLGVREAVRGYAAEHAGIAWSLIENARMSDQGRGELAALIAFVLTRES